MKPTLYVLCGIPGCGKSTWATQFVQPYHRIWISRDSIRFNIVKENEDYFSQEKRVFSVYTEAIISQLKAGVDVIADATHLNKASRQKLTNAIDKQFTNYQIVYIVFKTPLEECLARNAKREGRANVPEDAVKRMADSFTMPTHEDKRVTEIWYIERMNENE